MPVLDRGRPLAVHADRADQRLSPTASPIAASDVGLHHAVFVRLSTIPSCG
jgi:hypothetical protein